MACSQAAFPPAGEAKGPAGVTQGPGPALPPRENTTIAKQSWGGGRREEPFLSSCLKIESQRRAGERTKCVCLPRACENPAGTGRAGGVHSEPARNALPPAPRFLGLEPAAWQRRVTPQGQFPSLCIE